MLKTWIPATKDFRDQGLTPSEWVNDNVTIIDGGKLGKCMSFDGSTSRLSTTNYALSNKWSFSCWVKDDSSVTAWQMILGLNTNGSDANLQMGLWLKSNESRLEFSYNGAYNSTIPYTPNQWNHFVGTYDGSSAKFYINGELKSTNANSGNLSRPNLTIGGRCSNTNGGHTSFAHPFKGLINDVKIWDDHVLSQKEISELKKMLILHYPLDNNGVGNKNISSKYVSCAQGNPDNTNNGGRTKYYGDYGIIIPAVENADTFFTIWTTESLENGQIYTLSANVSGLIEGTYYRFPLFAQGNSSMGTICFDHNGRNSLTFTMNYTGTVNTATVDGKTYYKLFMDDITRDIASGQGEITINNIKLEKGSIPTPWCPNPSDALYAALGYDDGIEYDTSGYGNNGTIIGTLNYSTDSPRYLASAVFDGTQAIRLGRRLYDSASQLTVTEWFKTNTRNSTSPNLFSLGENSFLRVRLNSNNTLWWYIKGQNDTYTAPSSLIDNKWHFFAITFNSGIVKMYLDGVLVETKDISSAMSEIVFAGSDATFWGLGGYSASAEKYVGHLSDFRVYSSCLSDSEIQKLYTVSASIDSNGNAYSAAYVEG